MRKVTAGLFSSIDGVVEAPNEWQHAFDPEMGAALSRMLDEQDAVLLGRVTWSEWAGYWPTSTDEPFASWINATPKYVASTTLNEPLEWNATLIKGDLAEAVPELKRRHRGNLVSYGCGELAYHLVKHGLADEVQFWIHPWIWGSGARPFHGEAPVPLRLTSATTYGSGVAQLCYRPEEKE